MTTEQKLEIAQKALEKIDKPLTALRAELKEGERLSAQAAEIVNTAGFLKEVAREALSIISA